MGRRSRLGVVDCGAGHGCNYARAQSSCQHACGHLKRLLLRERRVRVRRQLPWALPAISGRQLCPSQTPERRLGRHGGALFWFIEQSTGTNRQQHVQGMARAAAHSSTGTSGNVSKPYFLHVIRSAIVCVVLRFTSLPCVQRSGSLRLLVKSRSQCCAVITLHNQNLTSHPLCFAAFITGRALSQAWSGAPVGRCTTCFAYSALHLRARCPPGDCDYLENMPPTPWSCGQGVVVRQTGKPAREQLRVRRVAGSHDPWAPVVSCPGEGARAKWRVPRGLFLC